MSDFLLGMIAAGAATAALIFFRSYRRTKDRLFLLFGLAFLIMAINQVGFVLIGEQESRTPLYLVRFSEYMLILVAIVDKNRK